jgi:hypothetical protein
MGYVALVGLACLVVWTLVRDRKRAKEIRGYAQSEGFTYIGASLPKSFPFNETSVSWASSVANAVAGTKRSKELVLFDCTLGSGKGSRTQTMVAVRGSEECFGAARFGPSLTVESVGEWALIYRSKQRLPLEEIEALLAEV